MSVLAAAFFVWFLIGAPAGLGASGEVSASTPLRPPVQPPQIATAPFPVEARSGSAAALAELEPAAQVEAAPSFPMELQPTRQISTPALMTAVVSAPEQISAPAMAAPSAPAPSVPRREQPMAFAAPPATPAPTPFQAVKPKPEARPDPKLAPQPAPAEDADADPQKPTRGGFSVVLAQVETEGEARAKLGPLKQKFGTLLGARRLSYHRVKEGAAYVWRVRSAGLSEADATDICDKIETAGGDCSAVPQ
jgi:hypothetical protein